MDSLQATGISNSEDFVNILSRLSPVDYFFLNKAPGGFDSLENVVTLISYLH